MRCCGPPVYRRARATWLIMPVALRMAPSSKRAADRRAAVPPDAGLMLTSYPDDEDSVQSPSRRSQWLPPEVVLCRGLHLVSGWNEHSV